jgi:phosphatidylglycerophosphatase A
MAFVQRWNWCVATCAGFGYAPVMPGTAGALWGVAIYAVIAASCAGWAQTVVLAGALAVVCAETFRLAGWAERYFQEEDSSRFVTDEVAGFLVTVLLFRTPHISTTILWAFPVTRVLDIIKIPPARWLERLPRGWGVLADDVVDSLYAAALLHALQALSPQWFA